jgi:hypothetical protein
MRLTALSKSCRGEVHDVTHEPRASGATGLDSRDSPRS